MSTFISKGSGMTTGLELWLEPSGRFVLRDSTESGRFADDIKDWIGLKATGTKCIKNITLPKISNAATATATEK